MESHSDSPSRLRFGAFDADLRSGELRRNGVKVRLQEQPFQILALLVERPGEVVTREELRKRLWPGGIFVDFENGLNIAVKKLRGALGDEADTPSYIETLPKRGYRFIAPVETHGPAAVADGPGRPPADPQSKTATARAPSPTWIGRNAIAAALIGILVIAL